MIDENLISSINQTLENMLGVLYIPYSTTQNNSSVDNLINLALKIVERLKTRPNQRVTLDKKLDADEILNNPGSTLDTQKLYNAKQAHARYNIQQEEILLDRISLLNSTSSSKLQLSILIEFFDRLAHVAYGKISSISYQQKDALIKHAIKEFPDDAFAIPSKGTQNANVSFLFFIDDKSCLTWHSKDETMLSEELPDKFYILANKILNKYAKYKGTPEDKLKETFLHSNISDVALRSFLDELAYDSTNQDFTNNMRIDRLIEQEKKLEKTEFIGGGSYDAEEYDLPRERYSKTKTSNEINEIILSSDNEAIQYLLSLSDSTKSYYGCKLSDLISLENLHLANKNRLITQQELSEQKLYILDSVVSSCTSPDRIKIKIAKTKSSEKKFITLHLEFSKTLKPLIWEVDNDTAEMLLESYPDKISEISGVNKEDNNLEILKRLSEKSKITNRTQAKKDGKPLEDVPNEESILIPEEKITQSSRTETEIWDAISSNSNETIQNLLKLSNTEKTHYGCNLSDLIKLEILQISKDAELITSQELADQKAYILYELIKSCDDPNRIKIKSVKTKKSEKKFISFSLELSKTLKPLSWEIDNETTELLLSEFPDSLSQIDGVIRENCNLEILQRLYEKKTNTQKKGLKKATPQITEQKSASAEEHIAKQKNNPLLEIANASLDNFLSYPDVGEKIKEIYERMDPHSKAIWGFILSLFSTEEEKSRFNNEYKPENRNGGMEK